MKRAKVLYVLKSKTYKKLYFLYSILNISMVESFLCIFTTKMRKVNVFIYFICSNQTCPLFSFKRREAIMWRPSENGKASTDHMGATRDGRCSQLFIYFDYQYTAECDTQEKHYLKQIGYKNEPIFQRQRQLLPL